MRQDSQYFPKCTNPAVRSTHHVSPVMRLPNPGPRQNLDDGTRLLS